MFEDGVSNVIFVISLKCTPIKKKIFLTIYKKQHVNNYRLYRPISTTKIFNKIF